MVLGDVLPGQLVKIHKNNKEYVALVIECRENLGEKFVYVLKHTGLDKELVGFYPYRKAEIITDPEVHKELLIKARQQGYHFKTTKEIDTAFGTVPVSII